MQHPAHTIRGRAVPLERGRATDPLPRRKASVETDSRRTGRLSHVRRLAEGGPDYAGDVETWLWRVGSPPVGRLAAKRRAAIRQPLPPRPGPVDARPRGTQAGDRERWSVWCTRGGTTESRQHRVQGRKWHLGSCRWRVGDEVGKSPPSAVKPLEQRALPSLGGSEVGREGGTPLVEAGVGLAKLGLALSGSGGAVRAGLTRWGREMRRQSRTPVGATRRVDVGSWASSRKVSGTGGGGAGHANAMRGG